MLIIQGLNISITADCNLYSYKAPLCNVGLASYNSLITQAVNHVGGKIALFALCLQPVIGDGASSVQKSPQKPQELRSVSWNLVFYSSFSGNIDLWQLRMYDIQSTNL